MAKKHLTIADITNLTSADLEHLKKPQLLSIARDIQRQATRKLANLEKAGAGKKFASPAYSGESAKHIKRKKNFNKLNVGQLKKEILIGKQFVESKTSTVTGAKAYTKRLEKGLGINWEKSTKKQRNNFWSVYNAFYNAGGMVSAEFKNLDSGQRFKLVSEITQEAKSQGMDLIEFAHQQIIESYARPSESNESFTFIGGSNEATESKTVFWSKLDEIKNGVSEPNKRRKK